MRRALKDPSGSISILFALVFPVLIGALGLGAEAGYWYYTQRKLQHAADLAAHAGAARLRAGDAKAVIDAAARQVAVSSGFSTAASSSMSVNIPPLSGAKAGNANSVEVILSEASNRLFSAFFASGAVTVKGRAVASVIPSGSAACVLALDPIASGAVTVGGSAAIALNGCDIASNSNAADSYLQSSSSTSVSANCIYAVGGASQTGTLNLQCGAIRPYAAATRDPYADRAEPFATGSCAQRNVGSPSGVTTITPTQMHPSGVPFLRFCNGIDFKGSVILGPGLYIIESDVTVLGGSLISNTDVSLSGSNVTLYFRNNASIALNARTTLNLTAPSSGPYSGLLFFGARDNALMTQKLTGSSSSVLHGAIYLPASLIEFVGNSSATNGCTQIIGRRVQFSGSTNIAATCANAGTSTIDANMKAIVSE